MGLSNTIKLKTNNEKLLEECPIIEEIMYRNDWEIHNMLYEVTDTDPIFSEPEIEFKSVEELNRVIIRLTDLYKKKFIDKVIKDDIRLIAYDYLGNIILLTRLSAFLSYSKKYKIHKDYEIVWTDSY